MTPRQQLELRQSTIRQKLSELSGLESPEVEQRSEMDTLTAEFQANESRMRALVITETEQQRIETRTEDNQLARPWNSGPALARYSTAHGGATSRPAQPRNCSTTWGWTATLFRFPCSPWGQWKPGALPPSPATFRATSNPLCGPCFRAASPTFWTSTNRPYPWDLPDTRHYHVGKRSFASGGRGRCGINRRFHGEHPHPKSPAGVIPLAARGRRQVHGA